MLRIFSFTVIYLEMEKDWELMSEFDKDEIINRKINRMTTRIFGEKNLSLARNSRSLRLNFFRMNELFFKNDKLKRTKIFGKTSVIAENLFIALCEILR